MDGLGNPLAFMLSSGNDHDSVHAASLLSHVEIEGSNIIGDKAYGAKAIREYITSWQASYCGRMMVGESGTSRTGAKLWYEMWDEINRSQKATSSS